MPKTKEDTKTNIVVQKIQTHEVTFNVLFDSPLIMNRFQLKAWQELLFPSEYKNRAERAQNLKHNPIEEFRGSVYRNRDVKRPALIHMPSGAFHAALAAAALDLPGSSKAKIERLTQVVSTQVDLFGLPQMYMAMVRNSDMNRTPDVRTRAIFPEAAAQVTIRFTRPMLTEGTVGALFGGAGVIVGIGDWRPQKGGSFGTFRLVGEKDKDFARIVRTQGRAAQLKALESPVCYDLDTEELYAWFCTELIRRERDGETRRANGKDDDGALKDFLAKSGKAVVNVDNDDNIVERAS